MQKKTTLLEFLNYENKYIYSKIDNAMTRQLSNVDCCTALHTNKNISNNIKESAINNLYSIDGVGILSRINESVSMIMKDLNFEYGGVVKKENSFDELTKYPFCESVEKEIITKEIDEILDRLTILDKIVYDEAVKIFNKKLEIYE